VSKGIRKAANSAICLKNAANDVSGALPVAPPDSMQTLHQRLI